MVIESGNGPVQFFATFRNHGATVRPLCWIRVIVAARGRDSVDNARIVAADVSAKVVTSGRTMETKLFDT